MFWLFACEPDLPKGTDSVPEPPDSGWGDADGDGYSATVDTLVDCDDTDPDVHPGATETCDGVDEDCDGEVDEGLDEPWYADVDGDGHGDPDVAVEACAAPDGYVAEDDDCDDAAADVHPGAVERCDGLDDDCDGDIPDEEQDGDGDGWSTCGGDCDDDDAGARPGAVEVCDAVDQDCDGAIPGEEDADADEQAECEGDCDDTDPTVSRAAAELCDGDDDDCDGEIDEDCLTCDRTVSTDVQAEVDAASEGEVVCVPPGTWGRLDFGGKGVTVLGIGGPPVTFLDGAEEDTVVRFETAETAAAVFAGFTVQNGLSTVSGGGIRIVDASPTLRELRVTANFVGDDQEPGGGIAVDGGAPTLTRIEVEGNATSWWLYEYSYGMGGGIALVDDDAVLDAVRVIDNHAGQYGGGIVLLGSRAVLNACTVAENSTAELGAGLFAAGGTPRFANVLVQDNLTWHSLSVGRGGGMYLYATDAEFTHVVVADNRAPDDAGAGIYVVGGAPTFRDGIVVGNSAGASGGGVFGPLGVTTSAFWDNSPDDASGLAFASDNVYADPVFLVGFGLDAGSPLIDAASDLDPDGSPGDIGLYGGPDGDGVDADGDGWPGWWVPGPYDATSGLDCDDTDAAVYPGYGC